MRRVGAGQTISYGELAARVGRPAAARAVGLANATNPIALIVPCHRVIGADGSLTGYGGARNASGGSWPMNAAIAEAPACPILGITDGQRDSGCVRHGQGGTAPPTPRPGPLARGAYLRAPARAAASLASIEYRPGPLT